MAKSAIKGAAAKAFINLLAHAADGEHVPGIRYVPVGGKPQRCPEAVSRIAASLDLEGIGFTGYHDTSQKDEWVDLVTARFYVEDVAEAYEHLSRDFRLAAGVTVTKPENGKMSVIGDGRKFTIVQWRDMKGASTLALDNSIRATNSWEYSWE